MIKKHTDLFLDFNDGNTCISQVQKPDFTLYQTFPYNHDLMSKLFKTNTKEDLFRLLDDYYVKLNQK